MGNGRGKVVSVTIKKPTGTDTNTSNNTNKKTPTQPPIEPNVNPTNKKKGNRTGGDGVGGGGAPGGDGAPSTGTSKGVEPGTNKVEPKGNEPEGVKPHDPKKMYSGETNEGLIDYNIADKYIAHLQDRVKSSPYLDISKYNYSDKDKEEIATFLKFAYKYNPKYASGEEVKKALNDNGVDFYPKAFRPATEKELSDLSKLYDQLNARERSPYMSDDEWSRIQANHNKRKEKIFGDNAEVHEISAFSRKLSLALASGKNLGDLEETAKTYANLSTVALIAKFPSSYDSLSPGDKRSLDFSLAPNSKRGKEYKAKFDKELKTNPYFARNMALATDIILDVNKSLKGKAEIEGLTISFNPSEGSNGYTYMHNKDYKGVVLTYDKLQLGAKDSLHPLLSSNGGRNKTAGYMNGWSTSYHGYVGTLLHETGHQVHAQLCHSDPKSAKLITDFYGKSDYKNTFSNQGAVAGGQSGYGTGHGSAEHFAESFAMYTTGAFPRTTKNKQDYEKFKGLMKDLGLSHLEGAYSGKNLYKFHKGDAKSSSNIGTTGSKTYTNNGSSSTDTKSNKARTTSTKVEPPKYKSNYKLPNGQEIKIKPTEKDKARGYAIVPSSSPLYKYQVDLVTGKVTKYKPGMAHSAGAQKTKKVIRLRG